MNREIAIPLQNIETYICQQKRALFIPILSFKRFKKRSGEGIWSKATSDLVWPGSDKPRKQHAKQNHFDFNENLLQSRLVSVAVRVAGEWGVFGTEWRPALEY